MPMVLLIALALASVAWLLRIVFRRSASQLGMGCSATFDENLPPRKTPMPRTLVMLATLGLVGCATLPPDDAADLLEQDTQALLELRDALTRRGLPALSKAEQTALSRAERSVDGRSRAWAGSAHRTFLTAVGQLEEAVRRVVVPYEAPGTAVVALRDRAVRVEHASVAARPARDGWNPTGRFATFEELDTLASFQLLPGGVALGNHATVEGDWTKLVYERESGLVLSGPDGELRLPDEEPAVLSACFRFAVSEDPVAVSIGSFGDQVAAADEVHLHPALRDTRVGSDIFLMDLLPWSLDKEWLPDGSVNPLVRDLGVRVNTASSSPTPAPVDELEGRTRQVIGMHIGELPESGEARAEALAQAAVAVLDPASPLAEPLTTEPIADGLDAAAYLVRDTLKTRVDTVELVDGTVSWAEATAAVLIEAGHAKCSLREAARRVLGWLPPSRLSLLTDHGTTVTSAGLTTDLRVRYVGPMLTSDAAGIRRSSEARRLSPALDAEVTQALDELELGPVAEVRRYAGWIALFRWALSNDGVRWIDLVDLSNIEHRDTPTADYYCFGSARSLCATEFGVSPYAP